MYLKHHNNARRTYTINMNDMVDVPMPLCPFVTFNP